MVERVLQGAVLEQDVSEVGQRGDALLVVDERVAERGQRLVAPAERDQRDPLLVANRGPHLGPGRRRERLLKCGERGLGTAGIERDEAARERIARHVGAVKPGKDAADVEHDPSVLHIDVVTLFPEIFAPAIGLSIVGRAQERGLVRIEVHHLLDALDPSERADDRPFGGGPGMVLRIEPLARILDAILAAAPPDERRTIAVTSAAGSPFRQRDAERFAALDRLVIVCGHYEGIDERLVEAYGAEEVSLGDFVLTGGEIPALAFLDATVRLVAGTINADSLASESFAGGAPLLDAPAYTRPAVFRGTSVPEVLLSGDHAKIAAWRREQSRARTAARRADLLDEGEPR
jgi:tRNA (guanine37-N1)-methyltransferase